MRASGAAARAVLAAIAFLVVGVWGVINLSDGDWFIGGVMLGSAVVTLWSLAVRQLWIDLTATAFMDSSGVHALLAAQRRLRELNRRFAVICPEGCTAACSKRRASAANRRFTKTGRKRIGTLEDRRPHATTRS